VSLLGSAGCQPAVVGSLPTTLQRCKKALEMNVQELFGRLPKTTGWQPVLPRVSTATSILLKFAAASR
jgi:hypothetical protein